MYTCTFVDVIPPDRRRGLLAAVNMPRTLRYRHPEPADRNVPKNTKRAKTSANQTHAPVWIGTICSHCTVTDGHRYASSTKRKRALSFHRREPKLSLLVSAPKSAHYRVICCVAYSFALASTLNASIPPKLDHP